MCWLTADWVHDRSARAAPFPGGARAVWEPGHRIRQLPGLHAHQRQPTAEVTADATNPHDGKRHDCPLLGAASQAGVSWVWGVNCGGRARAVCVPPAAAGPSALAGSTFWGPGAAALGR